MRDLKALADATSSRVRYPDRVLWLVHDGEYNRPNFHKTRTLYSVFAHLLREGTLATASDPSRRCRGYGKAILALTLEVSREIGLRRVLVTCDSDNIGSRKIIEHNGGQFESAMTMPSQTFRAEGRKPAQLIEKLRYLD